MKTFLLVSSALLCCFNTATAQTGCTDILATNYNASATINDGSCIYPPATISPLSSHDLADEIHETSGLCIFGNDLLTVNDDADSLLYQIRTADGEIQTAYLLSGVTNIDWEDITADGEYIYVGEFGNNVDGNRTDLRIYRVAKTALTMNVPIVDTISFSYSNQTSFTPTGNNNTDFDCEAFWVKGDSIYLATKQWISQKTSIYVLPKVPGTYTANLKTTLDVDGLVTGATFLQSGTKQLIALSGYSSLLQPFMYMLYDFSGNDFTGGNKRKVSISLPFHQMEGIATANGLDFYLSNEHFSQGPIDIPQQLHHFDLRNQLAPYITGITSIEEQHGNSTSLIYPNPTTENITVVCDPKEKLREYTVMDSQGRLLANGSLKNGKNVISLPGITSGIYYFSMSGGAKKAFKIVRK